jgi:hypothetical protein
MRSILTSLCIGALLTAAANGAIIGQLGVLDSSANGGVNPVTGAAWAAGDTYHLAFVTGGTRDATDPDIATYHAFVKQAAIDAGIGDATITWYCIGQSYNDPDRNTNAPPMTTSLGIILADGVTKLADDGNDLANGPDHTFSITETGGTYTGSVATGSSRKFGDPTQPKVEHGSANETSSKWWQVYNGNQTSQWHFYAISEELTVIPEPATLALLGLGGLMMLRRRH